MIASSSSRLVLFDANVFSDDSSSIRSFFSAPPSLQLVSLQLVPMHQRATRAVALFGSADAAECAAQRITTQFGATAFIGFGFVSANEDNDGDEDDTGAPAVADQSLALPPKVRQFLISPPPSPPEDWQPRSEDGPVPHPPPFLSVGETAVLVESNDQTNVPQVLLEQT
jgi:hypothetical protein